MVNRNHIRRVLKEEVNLDLLHNYFLKKWESQVSSGQTPKIGYEDTRRKGLSRFLDSIDEWYRDFVGGHKKAYELFLDEIKGLYITSEDISKSGVKVYDDDTFEVEIYKIYSTYDDYFSGEDTFQYSFRIIDGTFNTMYGIQSLDDIVDGDRDTFWDVMDYITQLVDEYLKYLQYEFGVDYMYFEGEYRF